MIQLPPTNYGPNSNYRIAPMMKVFRPLRTLTPSLTTILYPIDRYRDNRSLPCALQVYILCPILKPGHHPSCPTLQAKHSHYDGLASNSKHPPPLWRLSARLTRFSQRDRRAVRTNVDPRHRERLCRVPYEERFLPRHSQGGQWETADRRFPGVAASKVRRALVGGSDEELFEVTMR